MLNHSGERNLLPLPCGHSIHFRLWPHVVIKWNSHSEVHKVPDHQDDRFTRTEVDDHDEFVPKMYGDINQKALHQSAGNNSISILLVSLTGFYVQNCSRGDSLVQNCSLLVKNLFVWCS